MGIKVTTVAAHEDGKADYSAEVATLGFCRWRCCCGNRLLRPRW